MAISETASLAMWPNGQAMQDCPIEDVRRKG
jgi:hypothetical protein